MNFSEKRFSNAAVFLRYIVGFVFLILLIIFLIPASLGILNIGNELGSLFCILMILLTWGHKLVEKLTNKLKKHKWGKLIMNTAIIIFVLGILYVGFLTGLIIKADHTAPQQDSTVIVLGCQVRGNAPSLMLLARINAAYEYLISNPDAVCIVTGGKGDDENLSEAECMYNILTEKGIEPHRIYLENKAVNTRENIAFSKEIIEKNNLSKNTAIVTDIFHQYRSSQIVKNSDLTYGSVPAECVWYLIPTYYVRELVAITASFVGLA